MSLRFAWRRVVAKRWVFVPALFWFSLVVPLLVLVLPPFLLLAAVAHLARRQRVVYHVGVPQVVGLSRTSVVHAEVLAADSVP